MNRSLLWVLAEVGWHEATLVALWTALELAQVGVSVVIQPIRPGPPGSSLPWPDAVTVRAPLKGAGLWARRVPRPEPHQFDRIIVDQDAARDGLALVSRRQSPPTYLYARRFEAAERVELKAGVPLEGIIVPSLVAYRAWERSQAVVPSRLHRLPLLGSGWGELPSVWPFDSTAPVVAMAGVFNPAMGIDLVINALSLLQGTGQRSRLLLIGDGPDRLRVVDYALKMGVDLDVRTISFGWAAWLKRANWLVSLQSRQGVLPDVAAARAAGLPVVSVKTPLAEEYAMDGTTMCWMDRAHPLDLAEVLRQPAPSTRHDGRVMAASGVQQWLTALQI